MKKITLLAGGKIKNTPFQSIVDMYTKRMHLWSIHVQEVPDNGWDRLTPDKAELWVALCQRGKMMDSPQFAQRLERWMCDTKRLCFLVGPSCGFPSALLEKCAYTLSLSSMTWPHLMARAMVMEQIYRAQQHLRGHGYAFV
jgi:23S rRNA (pseudouridine1915-N3)-methyltransferase